MKEKIFNNFSLKILSAIFAIILWAVIVNIYDPTTGYTMSNITVQMINTEALTSKDYTYEVVDGSKISVYISGPKSVVTDIKASDIVATADLSKITTFADYVDIDVKVVKDGQTLTNVELTPMTTAVRLNIENRDTQSFNIEYDTTGQLADGRVILNQAISPASIKVTGPSSVVSSIAHVKATVNLNDAEYDIEDSVPIVLYDTDGNVIDDPKLELSKTDVDYTATVRPSKEVTIKYGLTGNVANGYKVSGVDVNPQKIVIAGANEVIDGISEITIPAEVINIEGLTADKNYHVLITDYIPENAKLVSDSFVTIRVKVSDSHTNTVDIAMSDISMRNLRDGLKATITTKDAVNVTLTGDNQSIGSMNAAGLSPYIDLQGLGEGDHTVPLKFTAPSGCAISGDYTVNINIQNGQTTTEPASGTQGSGNTTSR